MHKHALQTKPQNLLTRILEIPNLPRVVQSLEPRILLEVIRKCGLEDCGEILALARTDQLMRIFDDDLWRSNKAGREDRFDADRFGLWLEVLIEAGEAGAAQKIAEMDFDFVTAAFSQHILILDPLAMIRRQAAARDDGDDFTPNLDVREVMTTRAFEESFSYEINGYTVVSKRGEFWDALLCALTTLDRDHHDFFRRLLARCCAISNEYIDDNGGLYEVLSAAEQVMSDVASDREQRREEEGYVSPTQAVAFLKMCRDTRIAEHDGNPALDHVTISYFRAAERRLQTGSEAWRKKPADSPLKAAPSEKNQPESVEPQVMELLATLRETGVIQPSRLLLPVERSDGTETRAPLVTAQLRFVQEHDDSTYRKRVHELGYLANILLAGCSFQSRKFRTVEAADAVLATCNLGLCNWPSGWQSFPESRRGPTAGNARGSLGDDFLLGQDLVTVFRFGWSLLYEKVSLHVAKRLINALSELTCSDRWVQNQLTDLRRQLERELAAGEPWRTRENLEVLGILDQPSWAILAGLLDECPVVPRLTETKKSKRGPLRITTEFKFISENRQIAWAHDFAEGLAARLAG